MAVAAAAAMAVAAAAAATPLVAATSAGSPLDAEVAAGSEVAPASGLLDAEVAARSELVARSEVAAGSEVAGAAAAGSGSVTSGGPMIGGPGGPAAHPGERAACAKSHDLAVTKATPPGSSRPRACTLRREPESGAGVKQPLQEIAMTGVPAVSVPFKSTGPPAGRHSMITRRRKSRPHHRIN